MGHLYFFVAHLVSPFLLLLLWLAIGCGYLALRRQWSRSAWWLVVTPLILLALLSTPAASYFALGTLEWHYPPRSQRPDPCGAIVVLSGGILPPDEVRQDAELSGDTLFRCLCAAKLYRQGVPCPLVVSGGKVLSDQPGPTLAEAMHVFLRRHGVADQDIWLEDRSRSTYENAVECRKLLEERGIERVVLVTHASHMYRALRCFRRQGVAVTPFACHHLATSRPTGILDFVPNPSSAREVHMAFHEWVGIAWYWLSGKL